MLKFHMCVQFRSLLYTLLNPPSQYGNLTNFLYYRVTIRLGKYSTDQTHCCFPLKESEQKITLVFFLIFPDNVAATFSSVQQC